MKIGRCGGKFECNEGRQVLRPYSGGTREDLELKWRQGGWKEVCM